MRISALAGPAGHPLHPFFVPLPIGAFVSSLIFDVYTYTKKTGLPYLVDGAFWLLGVGLFGAVLAAIFGFLDFRGIPRGTRPAGIARVHIALNAVAVVLFAIGFAWRSGDHVELDRTQPGQLALSAVAVACLIPALWLGNTLVYRHGLRVASRPEPSTSRSEIDGSGREDG